MYGYQGGPMPVFVKKTMEMDENLIKKIRKIFGVETDKEAVHNALTLIANEDSIIRTHQELAGKLDLEDIYK